MAVLRKLSQMLRRLGPDSPRQQGAAQIAGSLIRQLARTREDECSCDEAFEALDRFAEARARGEDTAALMPIVDHHLNMCPECREELEALLQAMGADGG